MNVLQEQEKIEGCTLSTCRASGTCFLSFILPERAKRGGTAFPEECQLDADDRRGGGEYFDVGTWELTCEDVQERIEKIHCPNGQLIRQSIKQLSGDKINNGTIYRFIREAL